MDGENTLVPFSVNTDHREIHCTSKGLFPKTQSSSKVTRNKSLMLLNMNFVIILSKVAADPHLL